MHPVFDMIQDPTRFSLERAKHDLSEMKTAFRDDEEFSYALSSFVEAARSVTFHMQKQYEIKEGFGKKVGDKWDGWYGIKQAEMGQLLDLKFSKEVRNYSVHQEPIPTGATRSLDLSADIILEKEGSKPETKESEITEVLPTLEPPEPKTLIRWFIYVSRYLVKGDKVHVPEFDKKDVIQTCESIIEYLDNLVNECENKFKLG